MSANYKSKFTSGIVDLASLEQMSAMGLSETVAVQPEAAGGRKKMQSLNG